MSGAQGLFSLLCSSSFLTGTEGMLEVTYGFALEALPGLSECDCQRPQPWSVGSSKDSILRFHFVQTSRGLVSRSCGLKVISGADVIGLRQFGG